MLSLYDINWAELTQIEKLCFLGIFIILFVIGIIDYCYQKHKEKTRNDKI